MNYTKITLRDIGVYIVGASMGVGLGHYFGHFYVLSSLLYLAGMSLVAHHLWRQDEIEVFGSWEERKRFIRDSDNRKKQREATKDQPIR